MHLPDINDLIADLQLAKEIAIKNDNANGLVLATMSQAKLLGLDKPLNDVTPNPDIKAGLGYFYGQRDIEPLTPEVAMAINKQLEDEY